MVPSFDMLSSSPYTLTTKFTPDADDTKENSHDDREVKQLRKVSENTAISSIPPSLADELPQSIHRDKRPPFRSPSSVRALQLSEREHTGSPRNFRDEFRRQKWSLGAVRDMRMSGEHQHTDDDEDDADMDKYTVDGDSEVLQHMMAQKRQERMARKQQAALHRAVSATSTVDTMHQQQQQAPLVLLHITVLPSTIRYSRAVLERAAPDYVQRNLAMLRDKLNDNVFARGILVPHPCEEYDVLEERLLEALELCAPRVSPCGHFLGDDQDDSFLNQDSSCVKATDEEGDEEAVLESPTMQAICDYAHVDERRLSTQSQESDLCETCNAPMRSPVRGVGCGSKRWEISFYAANGLMRAGAWSAAWREMERVDVEIAPWMPVEVKRALEYETRLEEEMEMRLREEEHAKLAAAKSELESAKLQVRVLEDDVVRLSDELEAKDHLLQHAAPPSANQGKKLEHHLQTAGRRISVSAYGDEVPLSRLLMRYLMLLAQDKRNIAIACLSIMIALLAICFAPRSSSAPVVQHPAIETAPTTKIAMLTHARNGSGVTMTSPTLLSMSVNSSSTAQAASSVRRGWF